jgi:hypothetical protein
MMNPDRRPLSEEHAPAQSPRTGAWSASSAWRDLPLETSLPLGIEPIPGKISGSLSGVRWEPEGMVEDRRYRYEILIRRPELTGCGELPV